MSPPVFALDQDFPTSLLGSIPWPDAKLVALKDEHPDLVRDHEDWEVLRELRVRGSVDGLITLDHKMLSLPKEMVVLHQSRLSLVVFHDVLNDPFIATGLLMIHLPLIVRQFQPQVAQLWVFRRPPTKSSENPWQRITRLAARSRMSAESLYEQHRLDGTVFLR